MWLSRQMKTAMPTADADLGVTTIGGEQAGVVTRGEVRALPVYGPGGYAWLPENGMADIVCPDCGTRGKWTEPRDFNMMLRTHLGPVEDEKNSAWRRPARLARRK